MANIGCPRCRKKHYNTVVINRFGEKMPVQKCLVCGYLWILDEDLINLSKAEAKKMFVDTLMKIGKESNGKPREDTS